MIEIVIPTVLPQRAEALSALLCQLANQLPGYSVRVEPSAPGDTTIDRVYRCFGRESPYKWLLHIEDDAVLSPEFGATVLNTINEECNYSIVSFFSLSKKQWNGIKRISPRAFCGAVAFAVATKVSVCFPEFYNSWIVDNDYAVDWAIGAFISSKKGSIGIICPSQAQHRRLPSCMGSRSRYRQSPSYSATYGDYCPISGEAPCKTNRS